MVKLSSFIARQIAKLQDISSEVTSSGGEALISFEFSFVISSVCLNTYLLCQTLVFSH